MYAPDLLVPGDIFVKNNPKIFSLSNDFDLRPTNTKAGDNYGVIIDFFKVRSRTNYNWLSFNYIKGQFDKFFIKNWFDISYVFRRVGDTRIVHIHCYMSLI